MKHVLCIFGRLRFTIVVATCLIVVQILSHQRVDDVRMVRRFGTSWELLTGGQVWRLATGVLVQGTPGIRWSIMVPFLWVGVAEWHLGWLRTGTVFFLTDWLSTVPILTVLRIHARHSTWAAAQISHLDCGTSAAIYGTLAAFCASRRGANAWIGPTLALQSLVTIWLTNRRLFDVQHIVASCVGVAFGLWFGRHQRDSQAVVVPAGFTSGAGQPAPDAAVVDQGRGPQFEDH